MADDLIKPAQFARLVEKDRAFISRLMTKGELSYTVNESGRKMINPVLGKQELQAYLSASKSPKNNSTTPLPGGTPDSQIPNAPSVPPGNSVQGTAKAKSEIELKIREIELETKLIALAKEKGELITKSFHEKEINEIISQVLMKFDQLPGRVVEKLVDEIVTMINNDEPIDQIIRKTDEILGEECDKAKEEISNA